MKENNFFLDGSLKEQMKAVEDSLNQMTKEEHERAMSDEFAYLD